jgi:hypothetical protein
MSSIRNIHITPSIDGRLRYGDVTEPAADVTAAQDVPSDLNNEVGAEFSVDISDLFSGTDKSDGTYDVVVIDGSLTGLGLTFSSPNLAGATPAAGSVTIQGRWTSTFDPTDVRLTNAFTISFSEPGTGDTLPPTTPINVAGSRSGGNVIITHDPSSDPHGATIAGSGMDKYEVLLGETVVSTVTGVALEPSPDWQSMDIGELAVPGTSARDGSSGTAAAAGWIGENTDPNKGVDKFHAFRSAPHGGNFILSMRVSSITQGLASISAKIGLMCRFGIEADDPFVFAQVRPGGILRLEYRSVKGGSRTTIGTGNIPAPVYLKLQLVGSVFTMYAGAAPNALGVVASVTLTPPAQFYLIGAICGTNDSNPVSCVYDSFNFTTGPAISHTFASSSTGPFTARSTDKDGNVSALSDPVAVEGVTSSGIFPGTSLKFRPGFTVAPDQNPTTPAGLESVWQQFFTAAPNRKVAYRPAGIYGKLLYRRTMNLYYVNENVRPANPADHTDPNYDWSALDATFAINAVQNEGALIVLSVPTGGSSSSSRRMPAWLANAPYNGLWISTGPSVPQLWRFSGPDKRGLTNRGSAPYIVDEILMFVQAMHDHLVATGNINKVAYVRTPEYFPTGTPPAGYNADDFYHGQGLVTRGIANIFGASNIQVTASSMVGATAAVNTRWLYMDDIPGIGMNFPDMKMDTTVKSALTSQSRFDDPDGAYQKDNRFLAQANETNGRRANLYFDPSVPNPWGLSGVSVTETFYHVLWALSGAPKAADPAKRDSGLGQSGEDPPGIMPVHDVVISWGENYGKTPGLPTLAEVLAACDTFGPPGTAAFPYLPPGYVP